MKREQIRARALRRRRTTLDRRIARLKKRETALAQREACAKFHRNLVQKELASLQGKVASIGAQLRGS